MGATGPWSATFGSSTGWLTLTVMDTPIGVVDGKGTVLTAVISTCCDYSVRISKPRVKVPAFAMMRSKCLSYMYEQSETGEITRQLEGHLEQEYEIATCASYCDVQLCTCTITKIDWPACNPFSHV